MSAGATVVPEAARNPPGFVPALLPCGHLFCLSCIATYRHGAKTNKCPMCRQEYSHIMPQTDYIDHTDAEAREAAARELLRGAPPPPPVLAPTRQATVQERFSDDLTRVRNSIRIMYSVPR